MVHPTQDQHPPRQPLASRSLAPIEVKIDRSVGVPAYILSRLHGRLLGLDVPGPCMARRAGPMIETLDDFAETLRALDPKDRVLKARRRQQARLEAAFGGTNGCAVAGSAGRAALRRHSFPWRLQPPVGLHH